MSSGPDRPVNKVEVALTEDEIRRVQKSLSDPTVFPQIFKNWTKQQAEIDGTFTLSQIQGWTDYYNTQVAADAAQSASITSNSSSITSLNSSVTSLDSRIDVLEANTVLIYETHGSPVSSVAGSASLTSLHSRSIDSTLPPHPGGYIARYGGRWFNNTAGTRTLPTFRFYYGGSEVFALGSSVTAGSSGTTYMPWSFTFRALGETNSTQELWADGWIGEDDVINQASGAEVSASLAGSASGTVIFKGRNRVSASIGSDVEFFVTNGYSDANYITELTSVQIFREF